MKKEWIFIINNREVKVVNTWFGGKKLYVDGDLIDKDLSLFAWGNTAILTAKFEQASFLEICPRPDLLFLEIDAYLVSKTNTRLGATKHVFSSYRRLSLTLN